MCLCTVCCDSARAWYARVLLVLFLLKTNEATVTIGVVSSSPSNAQQLRAAAEAALVDNKLDASVVFPSVEPSEPLALPAQVTVLATEKVSAIVASGDPVELKLAADAAARAGVPLFLVAPTSLAYSENLTRWEAIHMYPQRHTFSQACAALCKEKEWNKAVLLHDEPVGARLVQEITEAGADMKILARRLPPPEDIKALRNLLIIMKKAEHTQFIVWCAKDCCERVLAAAQKVGLLSDRHAYILLALDLHTLDLEPYSYGGANVTGLQLFKPAEVKIPIMDTWLEKYINNLKPFTWSDVSEVPESVRSEADEIVDAPPTALILTYDVVQEAAKALERLTLDGNVVVRDDTLINYLRSEEWSSTKVRERRAGLLHIVELLRGGILTEVGQWDAHDARRRVRWSRPEKPPPTLPPGYMANQTFVVLIAMNKPYVMIKEAPERLFNNDRYEGYCIELIDKLSKELNFQYILKQQPGDSYDGMLKVLNQTTDAHFAITDLTITAERESSVDFTTPFMNTGISILYRKPIHTPDPKLFAFMLPFSTGVWFLLGVAFVGTSLVLYVVGRLCPEEWQNPYPCIEEPEALENQFTLSNAMWFTLGAVLCQGSEIAPVAYGSRAVASAWWIFALVITSSYTANLATLLAKKNNIIDFKDANELVNNNLGIEYGAKENGATYRFFNNSQEGTFHQMFQKMKKWQMPGDNDIGIENLIQDAKFHGTNRTYPLLRFHRVNNGSYAFLMESTSIEYNMERNCNLTQVGGLLDSKGYGIAMRKGSPYRQSLNLALLKLQEAGDLRDMKQYWWKETRGGGACNEPEKNENEELTMKNFMGLFLVLGIGCVLGIFISLADLMVAAWRKPRDPSVPYLRRLKEEFRFVFHFQQSVKPVQGPLLPPPSPETDSVSREPLEEQEVEIEREIDSRLRSASFQSNGVRSRRRSTLHNASVKLARHTRQSDASTPARVRHSDA